MSGRDLLTSSGLFGTLNLRTEGLTGVDFSGVGCSAMSEVGLAVST